jgi:ferritin-like metal-binding protein YciE
MPVTDLHGLFLHELRDLYSAESQIIKALPKMITAASDSKLKEALTEHLLVTKKQLARLDTIGEEFDFKISGHECQGIKGIITEAEETLKEIKDAATKDAAIIVSAQRVEHYEMAAYGGAVAFAKEMDHAEAAGLLETTLKEEGDADKALSGLAQGGMFSEGLNQTAIKD